MVSLNGDVEVMPDHGPGPQGTNGHGGTPSQADLMVEKGRVASNMTREMLEFSNNPSIYLARTRLSEEDIARDVRVLARYNVIHDGKADVPFLMWWKYGARISRDGEGRKEAVEMIVGERKNLMSRFRDRFKRQGQEPMME